MNRPWFAFIFGTRRLLPIALLFSSGVLGQMLKEVAESDSTASPSEKAQATPMQTHDLASSHAPR
jgi:hypothetical protein